MSSLGCFPFSLELAGLDVKCATLYPELTDEGQQFKVPNPANVIKHLKLDVVAINSMQL